MLTIPRSIPNLSGKLETKSQMLHATLHQCNGTHPFLPFP